MEEKKQTAEQSNKQAASSDKKNNNKALWWILGGCLVIIVISMLVLGGIAYWSYKRVKKEIKNNQPNFEKLQYELEKAQQEMGSSAGQTNPVGQETLETAQPTENYPEEPAPVFPENSERQIGYVEKVYLKNGKNYLDIDYIQWFTGDAAEKAMREDGECPKTGECEVLDDYYIRNVNPLIRTFEIAPDAQFLMQTYDMEATGVVGQNQPITLAQFKSIFTTNAKPHLRDVPYIVEVENQKITKVTEQYVP